VSERSGDPACAGLWRFFEIQMFLYHYLDSKEDRTSPAESGSPLCYDKLVRSREEIFQRRTQ